MTDRSNITNAIKYRIWEVAYGMSIEIFRFNLGSILKVNLAVGTVWPHIFCLFVEESVYNYEYVCACVCVYVCMYVCAYVCACVCASAFAKVFGNTVRKFRLNTAKTKFIKFVP